MKRRAVLIESSNAKPDQYSDLPGARIDIENWEVFLRSEYGGGWTTEEIVVLHKPWTSDVEAAMKVDEDCYTFVAFSGHGHEGSVVLNDVVEFYPIEKLKPQGDKGTLVIDSCRGVTEARQYNFSSKMESFANQSRGAIIASNAQKAESMKSYEEREILKKAHTANASSLRWMKALAEAADGKVEMQSCSTGEIADEDPKSGGYYTSLLLESAHVWVQQITHSRIHSTKDAHDYAAKKVPPQQHPTYSPSWLAFPFAAKE